MIADGHAYVDPSPQEEQKEKRLKKEDNAARAHSIAENQRLWKEMLAGSEEGLKCCLRAKISMQSNNGSMRDPTIYRTNLIPHAKTKDKYKAYPTYDLACPIVDSIEGVTHALRDLQYSDRDEQYAWFQTTLKLRPVDIWGFSRVNFTKTMLSKRKLQWMVDNKMAEGWDDPRFPTVAGIMRRGMTVAGLKNFILKMGASRNTNLMGWDKIWAENKKIIDPTVTRFMALLSDDIVPLTLAGAPAEPFNETLYKHPKDQSFGKKVRQFAPTVLVQQEDATEIVDGEEVTLMSWGNAIITSVVRGDGGKVVRLEGRLHLEGDVKKTKKKLTWLADTPDVVDVQLVDLDFIIKKEKFEEEDKIEDIINKDSIFTFTGKGESALRTVKRGETIQVERRGFYVCDEPYLRPSDPMRFLFVPDGREEGFFGVARGETKKKKK